MVEIERYFLWFLIYSFLGWAYESLLYTVSQKKPINRGFLNGPYCPIYGTGAVLNLLMLGKITNPILLFFAGALADCALEYLTSWGMEKLFHARWWDYRKYPLNLNGRVCLYGALVFGAFSVALVLGIHPVVTRLTQAVPDGALHIVCACFALILLIDLLTTIGGVQKLNRLLRDAAHSFGHEQWFIRRLGAQQKRMLISFPALISTRYNQALQKIRQAFFQIRKKGGVS